jgi:hypothetical protein
MDDKPDAGLPTLTVIGPDGHSMTLEPVAVPDSDMPDVQRDDRLREAKEKVVDAACHLSDLAAEFDGDLTFCAECIDALWNAVDALQRVRSQADSTT